MPQSQLIHFFFQLAFMLAAALLFGQLARKMRLPAVVGEIVGGICLGPTLLGSLAPGWYSALFPSQDGTEGARDTVIQLGMLFFLFAAGLEVSLAPLRSRAGSILWTSLSGIVIPFGLGVGLVYFFPALWGGGAAQDLWQLALFIGTALSISALPVIARTLMDLNLIRTELGLIVMTAATVDDLIGWGLFALILSRYSPSSTPWDVSGSLIVGSAFALLLFFLRSRSGRSALERLKSGMPWPSGYLGVATVLLLTAAVAAERIGLHSFFGAFLMGVALADHSPTRNQMHEMVYQFVISFFAPIYFVSIGLQTNFFTHFDLRLVAVVLLVASLGKVGGVMLGASVARMPARQALAIGFGMNARGAIGIVLASVALQYGLIDQRIFVALVVMAVLTSIASGPVMKQLLRPKEPVPPMPHSLPEPHDVF